MRHAGHMRRAFSMHAHPSGMYYSDKALPIFLIFT
jgi:hypothetical protein